METRLKELRDEHNLKQEYLAHFLNVKQRTYSHYERGDRNIPLEILCSLADFYDVSVDYILFRTNNPKIAN